jgi:serine/threonine-protein kinase
MTSFVDARRWEAVRAAFDALVELAPEVRAERLARLRHADPELCRSVEALLAADAHADERLGRLEAALAPGGADEVAADEPRTPDPFGLSGGTVSHFRILEPLGAGGMGVVYRAEDVRLRRTVALKFLLPQYALDPTARARFLGEARAAAALDHPNICTVHEAGESENGQAFLAMRCYAGDTLRARLARVGVLPVAEALDIAVQIARGLACAHAAGVVHRDLKPANVLLGVEGTVRILDFGLARARDLPLTDPDARMGTLAYMSPEQRAGGPVDARTDLWALGAVLREMLTGERPSPCGLPRANLGGRVDVARVVERLLREDPAERYPSAADLLTDLDALLAGVAAPGPRAEEAARTRRAMRVRAGLAALALAGSALGAWWWRSDDDARPRPAAAAGPSARPWRFSVAVLPLKNHSGDPAQEYFADGMTEELTTTLTKVEALRVIAHQSVRQFKRSQGSVTEIARALDVRYLVDGSVLQDGNRVRITASLIDATTSTPVWSERFERERRDVLALQREVALAITRAVEVALTPQDQDRLAGAPTVDPQAFDLYVRGTQARYDAAGRATGDFREAERYFAQAIARDPGFAAAYAGSAFGHAVAGDEAPARRLAARALELDPALAEAQLALALIRQIFDRDLPGAERALREAVRLNPGFAEAHHELSMLLMRRRRFDDALREARHTLYLAPVSARFQHGVGQILYYGGRYDEAVRAAERVLVLDPDWRGAYWLAGVALGQLGRHDQAVTMLAKCDCRGDIGYFHAVAGRRAEALGIVDTLRAHWRRDESPHAGSFTPRDIAAIYVALGDREQALDWLDRTVAASVYRVYLAIDPAFRSLHAEPRFRALLTEVGLNE